MVAPRTQAVQLSSLSCLTININRDLVGKTSSLSSLLASVRPLPQVIFIQEAGLLGQDPPGALSLLLPDFRIFLSSSPGPDAGQARSAYRASLVTLVSSAWASKVGLIQRSPNGAALLIQLGGVLLINAYLPSGLDWASVNSPAAEGARQTYDWIADSLMTRLGGRQDDWVVAGDFNETTEPSHRVSASSNAPLSARRVSVRRGFLIQGFLSRVDGFDLNNGAHTFSPRGSSSSSLLDRFIVPRNLVDRLISYKVWPVTSSDHKAVHMVISLPLGTPHSPSKRHWTQRKFIIPRLPGRRRQAFMVVNSSFAALEADSNFLHKLRNCSTSDQLEEASLELADALTVASGRAFRMTQGDRNRRPFRSRVCVQLNKLKMDLVRFIRLCNSDNQASAPSLIRSISKGVRTLLPSSPALPDGPGGPRAESWARALLSQTRKRIKDTFQRHRQIDWDSFVRGPRVSAFAQKIAKKARPSPVTSVVDPTTGLLSSEPDLVREQLLRRVTEPMRRPVVGPRRLPTGPTISGPPLPGLPDWFQELYAPLDVGDAWEGLCRPPTWDELRQVVGKAKKHTSPGQGALGIDLIQCCLDWSVPFDTAGSGNPPGPIARALLAYLGAVLRVGVYPSWTCTAWITTIGKGSDDPLDVRPISVLPEMYRLISRVLNVRLLAVFRACSILHPAQRAGLSDGDFLQCLDVVTSIIEDAKTSGELVLMLYDQSKAFDLVTPAAIRRACLRLGLPEGFISLVESAILRARARVRTVYGLSGVLDLVRSLRQGDPLASILYCIYIDPLHHLLDKLGGYRFVGHPLRIASSAFMDDTAVAANNFSDALPLHKAVLDFSLLNDGRLNDKKSLLFLLDHEGESERRSLYTPSGNIRPVDPASGQAYRYLGLWINLDLAWDCMDKKIKRNFWKVFYTIKNNRLPIRAARLMTDLWLLPVFKHALRLSRYATDPDAVKMLGGLQRAMNSLLAKNAGCPHSRNWSGPVASVLFNTKDMVQHSIALNIESLHLNLNLPADLFPSAAATRARLAGFLGAPGAVGGPALNGQGCSAVTPDTAGLLARVQRLPPKEVSRRRTAGCDVATKLGVAMRRGLRFRQNPFHVRAEAFTPTKVSIVDFWTLFHHPQGGFHPTVDLMRTLFAGAPPAVWDLDPYEEAWLSELVEVPEGLIPTCPIVIHTDGSAKVSEDAGAAAIFYVGRDRLLTVRARLRGSRRSFFPECVGCLMAVRFAPLNCKAEVVCDCRSALFVAVKSADALSWKNRLTSPARPALECLRAILPLRTASLDWRWIRAHTAGQDVDSFCNGEADTEAKAARGLFALPPRDRTWRWGAEQAILASLQYPSLKPPGPTPAQPRQVMGSVKEFLRRLQKVALVKEASKSSTMGKALRFNGDQVLRIVGFLSKFASSGTHATMAMALASYLPLANRSTWAASKHPLKPRCGWCCSGLKQDSPHIFSCPRLLWTASGAFRRHHEEMLRAHPRRSQPRGESLSRRVCEADAIRDCLALDAMGLTSQLEKVPLDLEAIRALPRAVLLLAAAFSKWATPLSSNSGRDGAVGAPVCIAGAWKHWISSFRRQISRTARMAPDAWNSAPLPAVWFALDDPSLPAPFSAVVFEGSPALPPPPATVWYSAGGPVGSLAWWALQLPSVGARMRLFEWAALASVTSLQRRMRWWSEAVLASTRSVIWAVVPATSDLSMLQVNQELICLVSEPFVLPLAVPLNSLQFWTSRPAGSVCVRTVLLFSPLLSDSEQLKWVAVSSTLPDLLRGCRQRTTPGLDSRTIFVPANWWWGTTSWVQPDGVPSGQPPFAIRAPRVCSGSALCLATCSSSLQLTRFSRYFGNLGVPPTSLTDLFAEFAPTLLEGDRNPPPWVSHSWETVRRLLRLGKRLG